MNRQKRIDTAWREGFVKYAEAQGISDPTYIDQLITFHTRMKLAAAHPDMFQAGVDKVAQQAPGFGDILGGIAKSFIGNPLYRAGQWFRSIPYEAEEEGARLGREDQDMAAQHAENLKAYQQGRQPQNLRAQQNMSGFGMGGGGYGQSQGPSYWDQGGGQPSMFGMAQGSMDPAKFKLHMAQTERSLQQQQEMQKMMAKYQPQQSAAANHPYTPFRSMAYNAGGYTAP